MQLVLIHCSASLMWCRFNFSPGKYTLTDFKGKISYLGLCFPNPLHLINISAADSKMPWRDNAKHCLGLVSYYPDQTHNFLKSYPLLILCTDPAVQLIKHNKSKLKHEGMLTHRSHPASSYPFLIVDNVYLCMTRAYSPQSDEKHGYNLLYWLPLQRAAAHLTQLTMYI